MFRSTVVVICTAFLLALSGCASIQNVTTDIGDAVVSKVDTTKAFGGLGDVDTYAKCAAADVVTTTIALSAGGVEGGFLAKTLYIKAFGHIAGTVVPVIGLSIAGYYVLKWLDKPVVTATAAGLTCFIAGRNFYRIQ